MKNVSPAQTQLLRATRWTWPEGLLWLIVFALPWMLPGHALIINEMAIAALFAVSLDLVLGYAGIVTLGHAAFLGLGSYATALFAKHLHPDPLLGLLVGTCSGALLGALCSVTILRGSDLTRLMVTLGVTLLLYELANKLDPDTPDATDDPDGDGLTNIWELKLSFDPHNPDSASQNLPNARGNGISDCCFKTFTLFRGIIEYPRFVSRFTGRNCERACLDCC